MLWQTMGIKTRPHNQENAKDTVHIKVTLHHKLFKSFLLPSWKSIHVQEALHSTQMHAALRIPIANGRYLPPVLSIFQFPPVWRIGDRPRLRHPRIIQQVVSVLQRDGLLANHYASVYVERTETIPAQASHDPDVHWNTESGQQRL